MLLGAVALEVTATTSLKLSEGLTRLGWLSLVVVGYGGAFWLLSLVLRSIPVGLTYAVWSGLGTVGAAVAGRVLFGEAFGMLKLAGVGLILAGVLLLNLVEPSGAR